MARKKTSPQRPARRDRLALGVLAALSVLLIVAGIWLTLERRAQVAEQSRPAASASASLRPAPDFTLQTADGATVRLSDLRGTVVLLNFWATWCPPCKAEMPDLNALHQRHGAEHQFMVLGINMQEDPADVTAFAGQRQLAFPLLLDPDGAVSAGRYAIRSLPTSLIIDREGNIRDSWMGQISREAMEARLRRVW